MHSSVPAAQAAESVVRSVRHGDVACIVMDNPPVNAISAAVRRGLLRAVESADADHAVRAIVIVGAGGSFAAGADIREFGRTPQPPGLGEVCNRIEACGKPVVAAISGAALGGGLEIALAAHWRVVLPGARLGLPEVLLGLLPGAGGTVRTPRLIGAAAALDLMLSGRHIKAAEALSLGLVDHLADEGDAAQAGIAYARERLALGAGVRRTRDQAGMADRLVALSAIDASRADTARRFPHLLSPMKIIDAVQAALDQPFDEAMKVERAAFVACLDSPQRAGLSHAFFAERETAKVPGARDVRPRTVQAVGVVGGGTMGAGIAVAALDAGLPVVMVEQDDAGVARGRGNVEKVYDALIAKGRMSPAEKAGVMARYTGSSSYAALAGADLVIEAVFEDMAVKQAVFRELDRVCKPGAVLATNTSYLDVDVIAGSIARPQDVIGLHFFSPANIMRLLEIVVPARVDASVVATAFDFARRMGKVAVRAGVCDGFIGNRILSAYRGAAEHMLEDGASPYEIDTAVRAFGFPMGPFQVVDLAGGDIGWATRKRKAGTRDPRLRYVEVADRLCERGWFGQKSGRGYYLYSQGARTGEQDPEVLEIIDAERRRKGISPRRFTDDEILRRYMAAMINEGAKVVAEGIAMRPLDVDVVMLHGYGFPRFRGGPMKYADTVGLPTILQDIRSFAREEPLFWTPAPLLERLVSEGREFASLNYPGN